MSAVETYTSSKVNNSKNLDRLRGRPHHLNFDKTVADRDARIFRICQGLIIKKFDDPSVTIDEKYRLAEKIYIARQRPDKEAGNSSAGETKVVIIKEGAHGNQNTEGTVPRPFSVVRV